MRVGSGKIDGDCNCNCEGGGVCVCVGVGGVGKEEMSPCFHSSHNLQGTRYIAHNSTVYSCRPSSFFLRSSSLVFSFSYPFSSYTHDSKSESSSESKASSGCESVVTGDLCMVDKVRVLGVEVEFVVFSLL